ncbi:MAG: histidine phosphatase family protein [Candidatus Nealsonbacteria bacterium]|nr:histidine phosphatase family protein [Candidatus Nealsonbacteria bacterium]
MNHLEGIKKIHNEYFVLRHGQSKANVAGIVISHLENGIKDDYSLTEEGENQVRKSVQEAKDSGVLDNKIIIYSSPFSRCKKTAEIAKEVLGLENEIIFDDRLRERFFGDWEKKSHSAYQNVWDIDEKNPVHKEANVESTTEVLKRTTSLIKDLEEKYKGKKILLVSHGDALQILQTGFHKVSSAFHRKLKHLETAEVRKLDLNE